MFEAFFFIFMCCVSSSAGPFAFFALLRDALRLLLNLFPAKQRRLWYNETQRTAGYALYPEAVPGGGLRCSFARASDVTRFALFFYL